ncbi:AAA family ATPase [Sphingomonas rubra]|uniref:MoxR-like ATPase n=1 Tax=Sphingomonas rubra TaxID=634430 RepID=A0A1I5TAE2_9SPHN|nr:AAA family ATPase [Sphingomonas rubra]SFP80023.1 MoxR-like ATPase [Sphingomonas rubra]
MSEGAFRFLLQEGGRPFQPSRCYVVADPSITNRKQWTLQLDAPDEGAWFEQIDDVKDWMLHGKTKRQIIYDKTDPRTPFRDLERDEVFREYLRQVLARLPAAMQARRKYALMPSIADDKTRIRYRDAVEAAIPGVVILPEPEMVAEYFRLLKRNLSLEAGHNNVILVVDVGASTANMTIIVSRRDRTMVGVDATGAQRDLRLRALRGDSDDHAGRWIDKRLAEMLGRDTLDSSLREIESAKVRASSGDVQSTQDGAALVIDRTLLEALSTELWMELRPVFEKLCERLYDNQVSSEAARRSSEVRFQEREVEGPADSHRLIDAVLLAGGTSMLPGFEEAMLATLFLDGRRPQVLRVGESFAVAAAAGGLAHILHNYSPPRLREQAGQRSETFDAPLQATLQHPLLLGIKDPTSRERHFTLLDPNDPFVDDGGKRPIGSLPPFAQGDQLKARLVPGPSAGVEARRGRGHQSLHVQRAPGRMDLAWDPIKERATVSSTEVTGTSRLWIDVGTLRTREEATPKPFHATVPSGALAVDAAEDVVLDLGMSKIVAVTAESGWISTSELERVVREGDRASLSNLLGDVDTPNDLGGLMDGVVADIEVLGHPGQAPIRSELTGTDDDHPGEHAVVADAPVFSGPDAVEEPSSGLPTADAASSLSSTQNTGWGPSVPDAEFSNALAATREVMNELPREAFDDIVVALLALSVRPVVLLAGPPGCGKSSLVRLIARLLGKRPGQSFHDVPVQAHWADDGHLFGRDGRLKSLLDRPGEAHLILFDEFNLTRPEYYMSRLFHSLESEAGELFDGQPLPPSRVFGTMNIDDSSRPPSPKVIDRCFLLELSQVAHDADELPARSSAGDLPQLPGLPAAIAGGNSSNEGLASVLGALSEAVHRHDLRQDLLPSRRVLHDLRAMLALHHRLDLQGRGLLNRDDLVDRLIASRVLVKLSGAYDQLRPALKSLEEVVGNLEELPRTRHRLKLARHQERLGFVSPWQ